MSKHTPGPWAQHTPRSPKETALIVRELPNHKRTVVAVIPDHREFGTASVTNYHEMDANARLVAAAPELLVALDAMTYYFQQYENDGTAKRLFQTARAAIEKATGQA